MIRTAAAAAFALAAASAFSWDGDQNAFTLPPTAESRASDASLGLLARTPVERLKPQSALDASGVRVTAELVAKGTGENLRWEFRWEPGAPWGSGTWVAFRDGLGRLREVRIILLEGSDASDGKLAQTGTWVRLVPQGRGSRLDLFLAGRLVTGGWTVPASLLDVMAASDTWLWDNTAEVDWSAVFPQRRWEDEKVEALRAALHKALLRVPMAAQALWLPDAQSSPDGTTPSGMPWGEWKTLAGDTAERGLGPWGVTLWTADGVLRGWKAGPVARESLFRARVELPGYSQAYVPDPNDDPAFAVNWIRNLGLAVQQTLYPSRPQSDTSADVSGLPFLEPTDAMGGYGVDDFPALAHLLAVTRPGQAYLVCLSTQDVEAGVSSAIRFREPAVLLPWVGQDNRVRAVVYAGPTEQTWDQWRTSFPVAATGGRRDHLMLTALPLPPQTLLPKLPLR